MMRVYVLPTLAFMTVSMTKAAVVKSADLEVQGHRGARWVRPENTLAAFSYALEAGVDTLEMDILVTKDNQLVVTHDPYLNADICLDKNGQRLGKKILVRSLTLAELKTYDCGSLVHPRFKEQKPEPKTNIPTLDEVFNLVKGSKAPAAGKVKFNIETKSEEAHPDYAPAPEEFVGLLLAVIRKHGMLERSTIQSFDYRTLKVTRRLEPKMSLSVLVEDRPKISLLKLAREFSAQIVSPNYEWLTAADIGELRGAGVLVIPWTVNRAEDWKKLIALGVDGLITDHPKALLEFLGRRPAASAQDRKASK